MPELPDWLRGIALLGKHDGDFLPVLADASGNLYVLVVGEDGAGTLRTVRTDASGRLIMVPRGDSGYYLSVDASGFLTAVMKGLDGATLRSVVVDSSGQIVMVPRGQSGNYLDVDASGYLTSVMKGLEGATLRTVAVDASGNLVAVMQGDYEGSLRTVKLDDAGRMSAFIIDSTDAWGQMLAVGNAELAARLGSLKVYDRRGSLLGSEDFDSGLGSFELYKTGTGAYPTPAVGRALSGGYSAYLQAPTGAGNGSGLRWHRGMSWAESFGFEVAFSLDALHGLVLLYCSLYDGARSHPGVLRWNVDTGVLDCLTDSGTYEEVATGVAVQVGAGKWGYVKLAVNTETDKYIRCLFGGTSYDLSAYGLLDAVDTSNARVFAAFEVYGGGSDAVEMWVDNLILTDREPT